MFYAVYNIGINFITAFDYSNEIKQIDHILPLFSWLLFPILVDIFEKANSEFEYKWDQITDKNLIQWSKKKILYRLQLRS